MGFEAVLVVIPLVIYLVCAYTIPKSSAERPDDFFIAHRKVAKIPFSNSAIAYAFQVATVYPFLAWAASKILFVPLLNTVFWGIGIALFAVCLPKLKSFIGSNLTLHGFLGQKYSVGVRRVTSVLTIVGLLGVAVGEIVWGSQVMMPIIHTKGLLYLVIFVSVFFVLLYISYGGQVSSIRTDQMQLIFSYIGVFGFLTYCLVGVLVVGTRQNGITSFFLLLTMGCALCLFWFRKGKFLTEEDEVNRFGKAITTTANGFLRVFLAILLLGSTVILIRQGGLTELGGMISLDSFGKSGMLSLIILPLLWQFVDMTNWQRVLALKTNGEANQSAGVEQLKKGLYLYAVESPFTWILFLLLGILVVAVLPDVGASGDPLTGIPRVLLASPNHTDHFMAYLFIVSVIAIMLSTVDSVMAAAMFTFVYDTYPKSAAALEHREAESPRMNDRAILGVARLFGVVVLYAAAGLFVFFDATGRGGDLFIGTLFAFYTAQLSFGPAVIGAIFLKTPPRNLMVLGSILVGALAGVGCGLYATFFNSSYQWYPVVLSISLSTVVYLLACLRK